MLPLALAAVTTLIVWAIIIQALNYALRPRQSGLALLAGPLLYIFLTLPASVLTNLTNLACLFLQSAVQELSS